MTLELILKVDPKRAVLKGKACGPVTLVRMSDDDIAELTDSGRKLFSEQLIKVNDKGEPDEDGLHFGFDLELGSPDWHEFIQDIHDDVHGTVGDDPDSAFMWKPGDTVQLKSGGPIMTINHLSSGGSTSIVKMMRGIIPNDLVQCKWFTNNGCTLQTDVFRQEALKRVEVTHEPIATDGPIGVTINGRKITLNSRQVSYEYLASQVDQGEQPTISIKLGRDEHRTLTPGQVINLCEGARLNIMHTGNA